LKLKDTAEAQMAGFSGTGAFENVRLGHQERMRAAFVDFMGNAENASILEIKLFPPSGYPAGADLHASIAQPKRYISSCALVPGGTQAWRYTGAEADSANGSSAAHRLPYDDGYFDWVYCDGIIERIGGEEEQLALIQELWRVSRKGIFVTAQNKRHPVDFGTGRPFVHWMLRNTEESASGQTSTGKTSLERKRYLLDAPGLEKLASTLPEQASCAIGHVRYLGIKAHFFLMVSKKD
jgi:hypothetical protein